jgi:hypothetical protein
MNAIKPVPGTGCVQWSTGGWFGSQLGSTAWMLVGAAWMALRAPGIAAIWLACFVLANMVGTWMWRRRDHLPPYPAIQFLLVVVGVFSLLALVSFDLLGPGALRLSIARSEWSLGYRTILVVIPGLMAFFALQEWSAKRQRSRTQATAPRQAPYQPQA